MYFVLVIRQDGVPGRLVGPASWDDCVKEVIKMVRSEKVKVNAEVRNTIEGDGFYEFKDGGGVYILLSDSL